MSYTGQQYVDGARKSLGDPNKEAWSDDELLEFVNDAREDAWNEAKWNFRKFFSNSGDDGDYSTVADQATYSIPMAIDELLGVVVVLGDIKYQLRPLSLRDYTNRTKGITVGSPPTGFYRDGDECLFDPPPNEAASNNIYWYGWGKPTRLTLKTTDTNLPTSFYTAIKNATIGAAWDADEDARNGDRYWSRYIDRIKKLKVKYVPEQSAFADGNYGNDWVDEVDPRRLGTIT
jgi:hypothetical protein